MRKNHEEEIRKLASISLFQSNRNECNKKAMWELQCALTGAQKRNLNESLIQHLFDGGHEHWRYVHSIASSCPSLAPTDYPPITEICTLAELLSERKFPLVPEMPLALHWRGCKTKAFHSRPSVAIIGSRHPSLQGREKARWFARCLAQSGISVWSGGAIGVDTEAIKGSLNTGQATGVVLGSGLDCLYPPSNRDLFAQNNIALISEFPRHQPPRPWTFPMRNFTLAWLTDYTLVIESRQNSGSHITADWARILGKGLGALVWPESHSGYSGNERLHEMGASAIESPEQVIEHLRS